MTSFPAIWCQVSSSGDPIREKLCEAQNSGTDTWPCAHRRGVGQHCLYCDPKQVIYHLLAFKSLTINKRKRCWILCGFHINGNLILTSFKELPLLHHKRQLLIHINDQHNLGSSLREVVTETSRTAFPRAEKRVKFPGGLQLPRTHRMLFEEVSLFLCGICSAVPLRIN